MMKRMQSLGKIIIVLLAFGCLPCQKTVAMSTNVQEAWLATNKIRDVVGTAGQCIAGYTLYETSKKVGVRGMLAMLASKPVAPIACWYLASSVINYCAYRELVSAHWNDECIPDHFDFIDHHLREKNYNSKTIHSCIFTARVLTGWLWFASLMYFLKVTQPLSVSAATPRMFA